MKSLRESIFDDDDIIKGAESDILKRIIDFITSNYGSADRIPLTEDKINITQKGDRYVVKLRPGTMRVTVLNEVKQKFTSINCGGLFDFDDFTFNFELVACPNLESLSGCPKKITGDFYCANCRNLSNLIGGPEIVSGKYNCSECNGLVDLTGSPKQCGTFNCQGCDNLKSLKGAPKKVDSFYCDECKQLKTLDGISSVIERNFSCNRCKQLKSLKGLPNDILNVECCSCKKLIKPDWSPKLLRKFECVNSPIQTEYLEYLKNNTDAKIITKWD